MKIRWRYLAAAAPLALSLLAGCSQPPEPEAPAPAKPGEKAASSGSIQPGASGAASGNAAQPAGN